MLMLMLVDFADDVVIAVAAPHSSA